MYYTYKYSNSLQSLTILFIDFIGDQTSLGIRPARVYIYIRRPSLPTVHFYGGGARVRILRSCVLPLFIPLWIMNSERFCMIQISILIVYNLERYSSQIGDYTRAGLYTSAVHLYLRSIFTAGVPGFGFGFYCLVTLFIIPLWIHISERLYYQYSNSIQSLTILFIDLGLDPRGFIYFRRLSLPTVHFYGPPGSAFSRSFVPPSLYHPFGFTSLRDLFYIDDHTNTHP